MNHGSMLFKPLTVIQSEAEDCTFDDLLKNVPQSSKTELVYAVDGNGNQVAVGLIVDGPFQDTENEDMTKVEDNQIIQYDETESTNLQWVAGEEECIPIP